MTWKKYFQTLASDLFFFARSYEEPKWKDIFSQVHYVEELIFAWIDDAKDSGLKVNVAKVSFVLLPICF